MAPAEAQLQTMADAGDNRGRLGIEQARKRFPELVRRAAAGERIVICRHQEPLAALVSLHASANTAEDPEPASTLLSLQGSGRQCWDPAGSSTPTRPSRPSRRGPGATGAAPSGL
jgi:prevent-host-death family protein